MAFAHPAPLHCWNKSHLVIVYNSFYTLSRLFANFVLDSSELDLPLQSHTRVVTHMHMYVGSIFGIWAKTRPQLPPPSSISLCTCLQICPSGIPPYRALLRGAHPHSLLLELAVPRRRKEPERTCVPSCLLLGGVSFMHD